LVRYNGLVWSNIAVPALLPSYIHDPWLPLKLSHYVHELGVIFTELSRHMKETLGLFGFMMMFILYYPRSKTLEQGAQTTIFCAVDESVADETGLYYSNCKTEQPHPEALKKGDATKLWVLSEKITGLKQ